MPNTLNGVPCPDDRDCTDCGAVPQEHGPWTHPTFLPGDWNRKVTFLCGPCSQKPANQGIRGRVCSAHFADRTGSMADVLACPDCTAAHEAEVARTQREDTIDPDQPWGQHIALTCRNHPELRWNTKNIGWIGARSIFFNGNPFDGSECKCSARDLIVVPK